MFSALLPNIGGGIIDNFGFWDINRSQALLIHSFIRGLWVYLGKLHT